MTSVLAPSVSADPSQRRLSDIAKRIAIPRDITSTAWGPVRDTCRDKMGIEYDGWQDGMGSLLLAKHHDSIAHTVGGFGLSAMRQVGKTYFFCGAFFGMSQEYPGLLTVWSAHHSKTHMETFLAMQAFADRRRIKPFIRKIYTGSGDEAVVFNNGSRILFGARERGFGRGIPGVDILMNDEGQILSEKALDNMLATLNTSDIGIHIYAGTPPKPEDNSEKWMRMRDEAWAIPDPEVKRVETEDLVWIEIGADDDADLDDKAQWRRNPSCPHRTPIESIMRLRRNLKDDGFRREGLGLYDKQDGSVFDMRAWTSLADTEASQPDEVALVADVSPDRRWSCIAVCGDVDEERDLVMVKSMRGTAELAAEIAKLKEGRTIDSIAITGGAARAIEGDLTERNIDYEVMTANEMSAAFATMQEKIKSGGIVHADQPELTFAMASAKSRYLQTGEAEAFDRREYTVDISPAVAAAGALYRWTTLKTPLPFIL